MGFLEDEQRFVQRMTEKRKARDWSQNEMAKQLAMAGLNWKQPTVARVEDGSRPLRFGEAMAIASFFGETIETMSAPETMTTWNVAVRLSAEALLAEQLAHRHLETDELQDELTKHDYDPPEDELPKAVQEWVEWLRTWPTAQASIALHRHDRNLYEAAVEESRRITVESIHSIPRDHDPQA